MQGMKVKETTYIYPPRTQNVMPRNEIQFLQDMGYIAQYKYNDTRLLLKITNDKIEYWGRHADRLKYNPIAELTDQVNALREKLPGYCLLDGGLLDSKHAAIKDTIVLWDIIVMDSQQLIGTTYNERYKIIKDLCGTEKYQFKFPTNFPGGNDKSYDLGTCISKDIFVPSSYHTNWDNMWSTIDELNQPYFNNNQGPLLEGLVLKNPKATLEFGFSEINNDSWMVRSRVKTARHNF